MEAADLLRDLERHVGELAALHEIGKALTGSLELTHVLHLIMQKVGERLHPQHYSLMLVDDAGALHFEVAVGSGEARLPGQVLAAGEGIAGAVAASGRPEVVPDVRVEPRFSPRIDARLGFETRSVLAMPLQIRGRVVGVIELVNGPDQPAFTPDNVRALTGLADYAAIAVDNARNYARVQELTLIDAPTGLHNARHLQAALAAEAERSKRFFHPLSLVFVDLDHFKQVNDTHGHMVGTAVLKELGARVQGELRATDLATRYGGDEFAVLLPETPADAAVEAAERWRQVIAGAPFGAARGAALSLTASFGVAAMPEHARTAEALLRAADAAMYRAKADGRNTVRLASPAT